MSFRLCGLVFLVAGLLSGCAGPESTHPMTQQDPAYRRDAAECRHLAGWDSAERESPGAYRAQAAYLKCMRNRGWEME